MSKLKTLCSAFVICSLFIFSSMTFAVSNQELTDTKITSLINSKIANDKLISFFHLQVETHDGNVILVGTVNTAKDAYKVIEIVDSIDGVNDVDVANLKVKKSNQPLKDMVTTLKIKALFLQKKLLACKNNCFNHIKVETYDGTVYLSGYTSSADYIKQAVVIAKNVRNVVAVKANIGIKHS